MVRRIKFTTLIAPNGIYHRTTAEAHGYRPAPSSRFAVTRIGRGPWVLTHVRSGVGIDSILPARGQRLTMTQKLSAAAALEAATHLDWSAFDAIPAVTADMTEPPTFVQRPRDEMIAEMREIVAAAI